MIQECTYDESFLTRSLKIICKKRLLTPLYPDLAITSYCEPYQDCGPRSASLLPHQLEQNDVA